MPRHRIANEITVMIVHGGLWRARAAGRVLVAEYFARVPPNWRMRLAAQYAAAVVETAGGVFKRQEPRWREQIAAALVEARNALAGGFR